MLESARNIYVSYVLAFGTLVILLMPLGESALSRLMTDASVSNNAFAQTSNSTGNTTKTSSANSTNFLTYKDSKGRFTVEYPSGWIVTPAKNRFESSDVTFKNSSALAALAIQVSTLKVPGFDIESLMSLLPTMARIGTPNFVLIQDVECKKYTVDGHKACSMINTQTPDYISERKAALLTVNSLINGTTYRFMYASTPDDFDSSLPTIDKMISSFRIPTNAIPH